MLLTPVHKGIHALGDALAVLPLERCVGVELLVAVLEQFARRELFRLPRERRVAHRVAFRRGFRRQQVRAVVVAVLVVVVAALSVLAQQLLVATVLFVVVDAAAGRHLIQSRLLARQTTRGAAHRALALRDQVGRRL